MTYDLIVIGAGPGGYVCAIRAAQLGMKTAIIEKRKTLGGTCANVGCIPSKALLHATELFEEAGHGFAAFGIEIPAPKLNLAAMMKHKADTVASNVGGVAMLMKKNKVDTHYGLGTILAPGQVEVTADDGKKTTLAGTVIVIATGSDVASLRGSDGQPVAIDEKVIVSSTGALELDKVPGHLVIVGAGVIGLELGSVWKRLGAKVTVVEYTDKCLGGMDAELGRQFQRLMEKQGMAFHMSSKVTKVEKAGKGARVAFEPVAGGAAVNIDCDVVLVATGRVPFTAGLGLEKVGVALERGRVVINDHFATNIPGIYAIGDVVRGAMLAHKAEEEGVALAEQLVGQAGHVNYNCIPGVVYTFPEVASIGKTEEELQAAGIAYKVGKFPFAANGRARANRTTDGFAKVLADATTDRVLGVHILGAGAGDLIHEAAVLMEFGGSAEDLARTCHAHPTMSEAVKEAALAVDKRALHM
jgi:dihydrolipoamide dehydrogenase